MHNILDTKRINEALRDHAAGKTDRRSFISRAMAAGAAFAMADALWLAGGKAWAQSTRETTAPKAADYIVIGAGSAGATLAGELAKRTDASVLVLEGGLSDNSPLITDPARWPEALASPFTKHYNTTPQAHAQDRVVPYPRGEGLGGCSSVNCMIYCRGAEADYNDWAYDGATGWEWDKVLPDYKELEDWEGGASELRGAGGPLHVTRPDPAKGHEGAVAFMEGATSLGYPETKDFNGGQLEGPAWVNMTVHAGNRQNTAVAFLRPAIEQGAKLQVLTEAPVMRLIVENGRCTGVQYLHNGQPVTVKASKEVILSAGALITPKLLTISGIGEAAHLKSLGIAPLVDLPGVGQNLQDHVLGAGVNFESKHPVPPTNYNHSEVYFWWKSDPSLTVPDINALYVSVPFATTELNLQQTNGYAILCGVMRPKSRGAVTVTSSDPRVAPLIDPNYLAAEQDMVALKAATELAREIGNSAAYNDIRKAELLPGAMAESPESYRDFLQKSVSTYFHPVGTAKMGTDAMSVVDPALKVYGVEGLRVADASVMPSITTGNTNAPSIMIGYRAAKMIAGDI
ncbi:GMC family oxidoreductase [Croceicoccus mobilis]|uniref:GMC oxidoreductase n=1 Tax=Croceicoccus mobilis TaxID=1703339 RepID=A0A917DQE8_9SPHN|nr:GMC family oxidoreductase N-terminal domain-containing protein [Croceicoccus mobilis]GGD60959.1 GMC oxidoreductase [Croceicoccus mobilis]